MVNQLTINQREMTTNTQTIELVLFKIQGNHTDEEIIQAASKLNEFVKKQPGFISRTLSKAEDGTWKDLVLWTDLESAQKAGEKVMSESCAVDFMGMIDESTMQFLHFDPKLQFDVAEVS